MSEHGEGRRSSRIVQLGVVLAIVAGLIVLNRVLPNIDLQSVLDDVATKLGSLTYLFVGLAAFVETGAFVGFDWAGALALAAEGTSLRPGDLLAGPGLAVIEVEAGSGVELEVESIGVLDQGVSDG
jgi:hypothetical protein